MPTIIDGTTGVDQIQNGTVTVNKIASSAVTDVKIANGAVTDVKIADGAVTAAKLAVGAVPAPTTDQVLTATAGAAYGAVGTYVLGWRTGSNVTEGATFAGSTIFPSGFESGSAGAVGANGRWTAVGTRGGTAVSGTWRAMGRVATGFTGNTGTLYLRIS